MGYILTGKRGSRERAVNGDRGGLKGMPGFVGQARAVAAAPMFLGVEFTL